MVGDGALLASLSRATGRGMRDIVATIQREQDEAIRSPAAGVTIVTGGPGTGKTAVALHRAAYLLYSDRNRFAGGGILVVGPSAVFVDYIATVLPSLGEDTATLRSLGSLVAGLRGHPASTRPTVAAIKGSLRMRRVLERAVARRGAGRPDRAAAALPRHAAAAGPRASWTGSGAGRCPAAPGATRSAGAGFDGIFDALWAQAREQQVARPAGAAPTSRRRSPTAATSGTSCEAWWPRLTPMRVLGWLADPRPAAARTPTGSCPGEEIATAAGLVPTRWPSTGRRSPTWRCSTSWTSCWAGRRSRPEANRDPFHVRGRGPRGEHLRRPAGGRPRARPRQRPDDYRDYAHVVVDEAQDVSPMQWRMIGRRGRYASWTVVGDPAQTAWTGDPAELDRARDRALGSRRRQHVHADHQLPQLGGDLRGGGGGDPHGHAGSAAALGGPHAPASSRSTW